LDVSAESASSASTTFVKILIGHLGTKVSSLVQAAHFR
jgi:hypothetical protein